MDQSNQTVKSEWGNCNDLVCRDCGIETAYGDEPLVQRSTYCTESPEQEQLHSFVEIGVAV